MGLWDFEYGTANRRIPEHGVHINSLSPHFFRSFGSALRLCHGFRAFVCLRARGPVDRSHP
jgi:hypothetical protein